MTFAIRDEGGIDVTEEDAAYGALVVVCGEWDSKHNTINLAKRCLEDGGARLLRPPRLPAAPRHSAHEGTVWWRKPL